MKKLLCLGLLALPLPAFGQQTPPTLPPSTEALQQAVLKLTGEAIGWHTQTITLQRENDDLKKRIAEMEAEVKKKVGSTVAPETPKGG